MIPGDYERFHLGDAQARWVLPDYRGGMRYKAMRDFEAKELGGASTRMIRAGDELGLHSGGGVKARRVVFAVRLHDPESGDWVWGPKLEVDGHVFRRSMERMTKAKKVGHGAG